MSINDPEIFDGEPEEIDRSKNGVQDDGGDEALTSDED